MNGNKQAYQAAYERALQGKFGRGIWGTIASAFEDEYTRRSREKGSRDGKEARAAAAEAATERSPG